MFTGLIEVRGTLAERKRTGGDFWLRIDSALPHAEIELGESIATFWTALGSRRARISPRQRFGGPMMTRL